VKNYSRLLSRLTQCQAFTQPNITPIKRSISVHEKRLGQVVSIQIPTATPTQTKPDAPVLLTPAFHLTGFLCPDLFLEIFDDLPPSFF
jgi:hypothetical protein